jgi:hypothetical protein
MTKEVFRAVRAKYAHSLFLDSDTIEALDFVYDLLSAEADHLEKTAPYATKAIDRLRMAAREVGSLTCEIEDNDFFD